MLRSVFEAFTNWFMGEVYFTFSTFWINLSKVNTSPLLFKGTMTLLTFFH